MLGLRGRLEERRVRLGGGMEGMPGWVMVELLVGVGVPSVDHPVW